MGWTANGLPILRGTLTIPWSGAWQASFDVDAPAALPEGPVAIASDLGASAIGWLDTERSGSFGSRVTVGVIAGRGGWRKTVGAQHYHLPVGVPLAMVVSSTAAEVLEVAVVTDPAILEEDYARAEGVASQVLDGRSWYIDLAGTTIVGPRVPTPAPPDVQVLSFDVASGVANLSSDGIVVPGMIVVDEQIGGSRYVRDVEVSIEPSAMTTRALLSDAVPEVSAPLRLAEELSMLARAAVRAEWLRTYEYEVIAHDGGDARELKSADGSPMPDLLPCPVWFGAPGVSAMFTPGAKVAVGFVGGSPQRPVIMGYRAGDTPLKLALDATVGISLGTGGAPGMPVALAPPIAAFASALHSAVAAVGSSVGPGNVTGAHMASLAAAIGAALSSLTAPGSLASLKVTAS